MVDHSWALLNDLGLGRGTTLQSVQRRLRVGTADAMRLFALREALMSALSAQPSRLSDDDRRAAFMAGWHDGVDAAVIDLASADAERDFQKWLAQRPEAQPLAAIDHAQDGDA